MKYLVFIALIYSFQIGYSQSIQMQKKRFEHLDTLIGKLKENKPAEAIGFSNEQLKIAESLNEDAYVYTALDQHSHLLNSLGMFDESLELQYQLLRRFDKKREYKNFGIIEYNIGEIYFQMRDFKKCEDFFQRCKKTFIKQKKWNDTIRVNFEIGLSLVGLGKSTEGIEMIKKNLTPAKKLNDVDVIINGYDDLANCYAETEDWNSALAAELEILNYPSGLESVDAKAAINQHLAEMYTALKQYDKAQMYVTKAIQYATEVSSNDWLFDCYKNQSEIYEGKGNYKAALLYHQKYLATKDSVYKSNYDVKMSTIANLYELEHKQNQISGLEKDKELATAKIERLYLIIAALVLLVIIIVLFIIHRKNKKERIMRDIFSAQLIKTQELERQRISKELHDSVGQNILFIKNQIVKLFANENPTLNQSVDSALEEVRNISKALYPNQLEQYGLISAINDLCERVNESTNIFVSSDVQITDEKMLSKEAKINCYRIVQECINNTIKHAAASAIRITGEIEQNYLKIIVQDNGKGFEKNILHQKANRSFGILNLEERVKILRGRFELETSPGSGTKSIFSIPLIQI